MSDSQLAKQLDEEDDIFYPDSDGQLMADNTKQFDWITNIVQNLRTQFQDQPDVFVAGDLLWYPVKGHDKIKRAPDVMVAFGRPKGHRGSYQQWKENQIAPQVVFEIRSPGNTDGEMVDKFQFYQDYAVEEYYMYDPETGQLKGWIRGGNRLHPIVAMSGWKSPRLGIRFEWVERELSLYHPDGSRFTSHQEESKARLAAEQRAEANQAKLDRLEALLAQKGLSLTDLLAQNESP